MYMQNGINTAGIKTRDFIFLIILAHKMFSLSVVKTLAWDKAEGTVSKSLVDCW
jgi:hypothetical protein